MKKKIILLAMIAVLSISIFLYLLLPPPPTKNPQTPAIINKSSPPVIITQENFAKLLQNNQIIQDLPSDASIQLMLFNNTAQDMYVISKSSIKSGEAENPDFVIRLLSSYISDFNSLGFCGAMKKAKENGDLGIDLKISQARLLLKYRSVLKYKDCFGL